MHRIAAGVNRNRAAAIVFSKDYFSFRINKIQPAPSGDSVDKTPRGGFV
jgi:hypothetical protein